MQAVRRKPFQGLTNILRFNWHFYALALIALGILCFLKGFAAPQFNFFIAVACLLLLVNVLASLIVSIYVYDLSGLYALNWLKVVVKPGAHLVNIHAGFDETSLLLSKKYPQASLAVFDFHDPKKHTEVSIRRARKAQPPYPGTKAISADQVPVPAKSADVVFCILSAHEIRDTGERILFFQHLHNALKDGGHILVAEHLRDLPNFLAYSIGAFHFHQASEWEKTFSSASLSIVMQQKLTHFITVYYLQKNGNAS